jgi:4-hydroxyproline epimerase
MGVVTARLHDDGRVTVHNVPSYRYARDVGLDVAGHGHITGDIAWGGNWFFLSADGLAAVDLGGAHGRAGPSHTWLIERIRENPRL